MKIKFQYKELYVPPSQEKFNERFKSILQSKNIDYDTLTKSQQLKVLNKYTQCCKVCPNCSYDCYQVKPMNECDVIAIARANLTQTNNYLMYIAYEMIHNLGFTKQSVYYTNSCFCKFDKVYEYQDDNFKRCFLYKDLELSGFNPKVIILLGNDALQRFFNIDNTVLNILGEVYYTNFNGRSVPVIPLPHPSYLMRDPKLKDSIYKFCLALNPILKEWNYVLPNKVV